VRVWSEAASWISRRKRSTLTPRPSPGQDLDHDLPAERDVVRQEDVAHPAAAELALNVVGFAQGGL